MIMFWDRTGRLSHCPVMFSTRGLKRESWSRDKEESRDDKTRKSAWKEGDGG